MRDKGKNFFISISPMRADARNWYPRPELNRDGRFRKQGSVLHGE